MDKVITKQNYENLLTLISNNIRRENIHGEIERFF